jgi:hypothetical protein
MLSNGCWGYFIGHPNADKSGQILVLATAAEVGLEIDAEDCHPTGRSYPDTGAESRRRYFRQFPGGNVLDDESQFDAAVE